MAVAVLRRLLRVDKASPPLSPRVGSEPESSPREPRPSASQDQAESARIDPGGPAAAAAGPPEESRSRWGAAASVLRGFFARFLPAFGDAAPHRLQRAAAAAILKHRKGLMALVARGRTELRADSEAKHWRAGGSPWLLLRDVLHVAAIAARGADGSAQAVIAAGAAREAVSVIAAVDLKPMRRRSRCVDGPGLAVAAAEAHAARYEAAAAALFVQALAKYPAGRAALEAAGCRMALVAAESAFGPVEQHDDHCEAHWLAAGRGAAAPAAAPDSHGREGSDRGDDDDQGDDEGAIEGAAGQLRASKAALRVLS